jgi:hypothetical protein
LSSDQSAIFAGLATDGPFDWYQFPARKLGRFTLCATRPIKKTTYAHVAQLVERVLGKDEVTGSIPVMGSMSLLKKTLDYLNRR